MKLILVEDDTFFQQFYAMKLQKSGYVVDTANDGEEGIAKIRANRPDVVLLDLIMPRKNGFEVLEEMAKDPELKTIPVLVFSTLGQEQDIQKAMQLGAKGYVNKSFFDFEQLLAKVKSMKPG